MAFKKKSNKNTIRKIKDPIDCLNMTLLQTQRDNKLNFDDDYITGEEISIKEEKMF